MKHANGIGERIRVLRQAKGITQKQLANSSGIHRSHIGVIERGKCDVTLKTLIRVGHGLEMPLSVLLKGLKARK